MYDLFKFTLTTKCDSVCSAVNEIVIQLSGFTITLSSVSSSHLIEALIVFVTSAHQARLWRGLLHFRMHE